MKIFTIIARVLLGLIFVFFGSNGLLHFLPMPPLPQGVAGEYLHSFFASGYIYVISGFQVIGGLLLLIGRFVSFAATPAALNRKLLQVSIDFSLTNRRAQVEAMPVLTPTTICSRRWAFARP